MFKRIIKSIFIVFLFSGCATWDGLKKDTSSVWEVISNKSSDLWESTKEGISDTYEYSKEKLEGVN